jgi:hypothetical protein
MSGKYITADATAPAHGAQAVTPSDSTVLPGTRALYVGGAGNVAVVMSGNGATITFTGVTAGFILPVQVTKVMATNTTATNIVALW